MSDHEDNSLLAAQRCIGQADSSLFDEIKPLAGNARLHMPGWKCAPGAKVKNLPPHPIGPLMPNNQRPDDFIAFVHL
jgi:hypothetical protein